MTNYQEREGAGCSFPKCRAEFEIRFLQGATALNPEHPIQLCDKHHTVFSEELRALGCSYPDEPTEEILVQRADRLGNDYPQPFGDSEYIKQETDFHYRPEEEDEYVEETKPRTSIDIYAMWAEQ